MNRIYYLALASLCLLSFIGCKPSLTPGADVEHATLVTFDQLRDLTKDEKVFWWLGGDADHQYFRTKDGFYRMTTSTEYFDEARIQRAKNNFDRGVNVGDTRSDVMIRGDRIGAPAEGVDPNLPYGALDPIK